MAITPVRPGQLPTEVDWRRIPWIYDPAPDWIWKDEAQFKRYIQMEAAFAIRQIEIDQQSLMLEKERIQAAAEFSAQK